MMDHTTSPALYEMDHFSSSLFKAFLHPESILFLLDSRDLLVGLAEWGGMDVISESLGPTLYVGCVWTQNGG